MRIAIIGGGISGLSLYLYLRKSGLTEKHEVFIYERREKHVATSTSDPIFSSSHIGATIGVHANGLATLRALDVDLYEDAVRSGNLVSTWTLLNARGWVLANVPATPMGGKTLFVGREDFTDCFRRRVPDSAVIRKKVVEIVSSNDSQTLVLHDGSVAHCDLVIGADGIWSTVRRAMFTSSGGKGREHYQYSPHYEGLIGVGGFVSDSYLVDVADDEISIVFGATGFFGYGYATSSSPQTGNGSQERAGGWWSTYSLKECPDDWRDIDPEEGMRQLQTRHSNWNNPTIQNIIKNVKIDAVWPTFTTPLLPTWADGAMVLVGDAAHALQPSSGQGASMALEDSEALAMLLHHCLDRDPKEGHIHAIKLYSDLRMPRVAMVHKKAEELGAMKQDMSLLQEMAMYFFIWLINRFGLSKTYDLRLFEYNGPEEVQKIVDAQRTSS